jgi:CheY-like chemotaxis protein
MVIDDEPLLGQTLRLAFGETDEVVVATSGETALAMFEREADFDLVLCDLKMPELSGIEVYERVVARRP